MKRKRVKLHSIGERIKWLRQNKEVFSTYHEKIYDETGITQQEFADRLNVSLDTVKNWEQGYNYPSIDMLVELCSFFKCDFDFLLGNQEVPNKYAGLSEGAAKTLFDAYMSNDPICEVISDLIENQDIIQQIHKLVSARYDRFCTVTDQEPFYHGSFLIGQTEMLNADIMKLFILIWSFINKKRTSNSLENLNDRLRI